MVGQANILGQIRDAARIGPGLFHAQQEIKSTYGDDIIIKPKSLLKFGRTNNVDAGVPTTVMTLAGAAQR